MSVKIASITVTYTTDGGSSGETTTKKDISSISLSPTTCTSGGTYTPTLTVKSGDAELASTDYGTVTYTSNYSDVLSYSNGTFTIGTVTEETKVTLTVSIAESTNYNTYTGTFTITVSPASEPNKDTATFSYDWTADGNKGTKDWTDKTSRTEGDVTVKLSSNTNDSKYAIEKGSTDTITISSTQGNIAKVVMTFERARSASYSVDNGTANDFEATSLIIAKGLGKASASISIKNKNNNSDLNLTKLEVYLMPTSTITFKQDGTTQAENETIELGSTPKTVSVSTSYGMVTLSGTDNSTGITYSNSNGNVTFTAPTATGTYTLKASVAAEEGICTAAEATYTITVTKKQFDAIDDQDLDLVIGSEATALSSLGIVATDDGDEVDGAKIEWKVVTNESVIGYDAAAGTIKPNAKGTATMTATISATGYDDEVVNLTINVTNKQFTSLALNKDLTSGKTLSTDELTTEIKNVLGTDATNATINYAVKTNASKVITISGNTITANTDVEGTAVVNATVTADGYENLIVPITISVTKTEVKKATVEVEDQFMEKGGCTSVGTGVDVVYEPYLNSVKFEDAIVTKYNVTYSFANEEKAALKGLSITGDGATITSDGDKSSTASGIIVNATVTSVDGSFAATTVSFKLDVIGSIPPASLSFNPSAYTISVGEALTPTFTATGRYVRSLNKSTNIPADELKSRLQYQLTDEAKKYLSLSEDGLQIIGLATTSKAVEVKARILKKYGEYRTCDWKTIKVTVGTGVLSPKISPKSQSTAETSLTATITNNTTGATVYYTTDGSDPIVGGSNTNSFTATTETVTLSANTTVKAMAVSGGSKSVIVEESYVFLKDGSYVVQNKDYDAGDQQRESNITMTLGGIHTRTKANPEVWQDDIWDVISKTGSLVGSSNVLTNGYSICSQQNAVTDNATVGDNCTIEEKNQWDNEYKHYATSNTSTALDKRTTGLPAYGCYYKFEPTKNGTLTVSVLQEGSIYAEGKGNSGELEYDYTKVRIRPLYFVDEQGNAIAATDKSTTSRIDARWNNIVFAELAGDDAYSKEGMQSFYSFYLKTLYQLYKEKNNSDASSDADVLKLCDNETTNPILTLHSDGTGYSTDQKTYINAVQQIFDTDANDNVQTALKDNVGYFLMTEGYAKYTFPVEAGKTYFLFGNRTKIALSGYEFTVSGSGDAGDNDNLTLGAEATNNSSSVSQAKDAHKNVTVGRTFTEGNWYSLVLPFSVSTKQLHEVLGSKNATTTEGNEVDDKMKDVSVLYFDNITIGDDKSTLKLTRHFNQMIVAGTPVFFRANRTVSNPVFKNVKIEATTPVDVTDGTYTFTGSYDKASAPQFSYILRNSTMCGDNTTATGRFDQYTSSSTGYELDATSAWIKGATAALAPLSVMGLGGSEDDNTSGVINVSESVKANGAISGNAAIYNMNGQVVGHGLELYALPKGVYITNGKKYVVK